MKLTINQFIDQNDFWVDEFYAYAIHVTDGGAKYLYRITVDQFIKAKPLEEVEVEMFRLDGINWERASRHIEEYVRD